MHPLVLLAVTQDAAHSKSILDALPHLAGMLVVMATLAFLWGICALTATIIKLLIGEKITVSAPTTVPTPVVAASAPVVASAPEPVDTRIAPEIVAVIAAAVASITGQQPVRIISIKPSSTSWERAGRQSVLTSHRIR